MTRCMKDLCFQLSYLYFFFIGQKMIARRRTISSETKQRTLLLQILIKQIVLLVQADLGSGCFFEFSRAENVIEMSVRVEKILYFEIVLFQKRKNGLHIAAWINYSGFLGFSTGNH